MKKIVKALLLLSSFLFFQKSVHAQTMESPLKIYDLNPGVENDSSVSSEGKFRLYVNFKLSDPSLADSVFFSFGTTEGSKDVVTETGNFSKKGSVYSLKVQGPSYEVINTEVSCRLKIKKKELSDCKYLTLVAKDKSGLYTNALTLRIN